MSDGQNTAAAIDIALAVLDLIAAGVQRQAIIDDLRTRQAAGATDAEISAYLKDLADRKLDELNAVKLGE